MAETAYERVIDGLRNHGRQVHDRGRKAEAQCPAHDDRRASLGVTAIEGMALVYCQAQCATEDVTAALGLTMADLYDNRRGIEFRYTSGRVVHRTWDKRFYQDGDRAKVELYRAERLRGVGSKAHVYLVEGEKSVHAVEAAGRVAVSAPMGASNFTKCNVEPLRGHLVIAVVDRDEGGRRWAADVAQKLAGVAADLRFVQSRTTGEKDDVCEHIAAGRSLDELEPLDPADIPGDVSEADGSQTKYLDGLRAALVDSNGLDQIPDPVPLIGPEFMYLDSLVWVIGKPGSMKSFIMLDIAGCVGSGENWQGHPTKQGPVLYLVAEGVAGVKKRVRAWEKAMSHTMTGVQFLPVAVQVADPEQWRALIDLAGEIQPALVIIDTQARVTVGLEENSNREMGEFVDQAERLRQVCGACVAIVHHIGRAGDNGRGASTLDGAVSTLIKVTKERGSDLITLECMKNKDGEEWDNITLRAVPMGDSIVLAPGDTRGAAGPSPHTLRVAQTWWEAHRDNWTSVSALVDSEVAARATIYRHLRELEDRGLVQVDKTARYPRYRLTTPPSDRQSQTSHGIS